MEEFLNALDGLIAETEGLSVIELVGALELAKMEEFLNALDDLIAETEGLSVIELVGALELAKNDIIAGLAVAELLTEDGEEATA